ncbi:hypothetical protein B0T18DRAFT_124710 [Schizothecium vesticola]|uniref:Uncharacterized protein n=1 Tax=Schizothecium vesticola TaxID=314040 RepID=A0AA40F320_9PEZI|nr:hypothetical protein B0T18DRAFT_124710 [Schizothecium vesticola]
MLTMLVAVGVVRLEARVWNLGMSRSFGCAQYGTGVDWSLLSAVYRKRIPFLTTTPNLMLVFSGETLGLMVVGPQFSFCLERREGENLSPHHV